MTQQRDDKELARVEDAAAGDDREGPAEPVHAADDHAPPPRRGSGGGLMLAIALVLFVAVAIALVTWPKWRQQLAQFAGMAADDQRIAAVESDNAALRNEVGQLRQAVASLRADATKALQTAEMARTAAAAVDAKTVEALAQRLATVEQAQAALRSADPAAVAELGQRGEALAGQVAELQTALSQLQKSVPDAATVLRLTEQVQAAEAAARAVAEKRDSANALLLAAAQLREAVDRAQPFTEQLATLGIVGQGNSRVTAAIEALQGHADRGIPTRAALAASFGDLAPRIVRADYGPEEEGWWRQTVQRLSSIVSIRRTDTAAEGTSAAAIVARAEGLLAQGDLTGAVNELAGLSAHSAAVAAAWLGDAKARLAADKALSDLTAHAVARSGNSNG